MATVETILISAEKILLGSSMVTLLLGTGIYVTVKSRLFQLRAFPFILKNTAGTLLRSDKGKQNDNISSFQAVTTALAGTMGVGNIAGVSTALVAGGPGAIFWMWIGALFGMMTKYAEIYLAVKHRRKDNKGRYYGGPMYYMQDCTGGRWLACIFAFLCAACSFGIGNITQVNSVSTAMESAFGIPAWISGVVVAAAVALVIFGGVRRVASVTEMVIPFISIAYMCCAGVYLYIYQGSIIPALKMILQDALGFRNAAGGLVGYGVSRAMSIGLSRGVFTNEAGLGSAPIAHASADCKSPELQGIWGIFEVFLDTIVMCTVTALVILVAGDGMLWYSGLDGAPLTSAAFADAFGVFGTRFIAISIAFFAVSAMLGWCFYGQSALAYLSHGNKKAILVYQLLFIICILAGAVAELTTVWRLSDCLNALMAIPNVTALILLRKEIKIPDA